jgi:hypothetical protein
MSQKTGTVHIDILLKTAVFIQLAGGEVWEEMHSLKSEQKHSGMSSRGFYSDLHCKPMSTNGRVFIVVMKHGIEHFLQVLTS